MIKILNLKLVRFSEYQNIKIFLWKATLKIGQRKFFWLKNSITVSWSYVISGLNSEEIVRTFPKKNGKNKESLELKIIKQKRW